MQEELTLEQKKALLTALLDRHGGVFHVRPILLRAGLLRFRGQIERLLLDLSNLDWNAADFNNETRIINALAEHITEEEDREKLAPAGPIPPPARVSPLPTDSAERKATPLWTACMQYAPAAMAAMAQACVRGNEKHTPGEPLYHARGKSNDHRDCIARHLVDYDALRVWRQRGCSPAVEDTEMRMHLGYLMARVAFFVQEELEKLGAPLAPRARTNDHNEIDHDVVPQQTRDES